MVCSHVMILLFNIRILRRIWSVGVTAWKDMEFADLQKVIHSFCICANMRIKESEQWRVFCATERARGRWFNLGVVVKLDQIGSSDCQPPPNALTSKTLAVSLRPISPSDTRSLVSAIAWATSTLR